MLEYALQMYRVIVDMRPYSTDNSRAEYAEHEKYSVPDRRRFQAIVGRIFSQYVRETVGALLSRGDIGFSTCWEHIVLHEARYDKLLLLFFSYARRDRDAYLKQFYLDLVDMVRRRGGIIEETIGFFDSEDIEPGEGVAGSS